MGKYKGSHTFGKYEIFLNVGFWRWGPYKIGSTTVHRIGPIRVFVDGN